MARKNRAIIFFFRPTPSYRPLKVIGRCSDEPDEHENSTSTTVGAGEIDDGLSNGVGLNVAGGAEPVPSPPASPTARTVRVASFPATCLNHGGLGIPAAYCYDVNGAGAPRASRRSGGFAPRCCGSPHRVVDRSTQRGEHTAGAENARRQSVLAQPCYAPNLNEVIASGRTTSERRGGSIIDEQRSASGHRRPSTEA